MFTFSPEVLRGKIVAIRIGYASLDGSQFSVVAENPNSIGPERYDPAGGDIRFDDHVLINWDTKIIMFSSALHDPLRTISFTIPVTEKIEKSFADLINGWHALISKLEIKTIKLDVETSCLESLSTFALLHASQPFFTSSFILPATHLSGSRLPELTSKLNLSWISVKSCPTRFELRQTRIFLIV